MIHVILEGIRAKLSSISFGMDDKIDRLSRKTTALLVLLGAMIIGSNRYFGSPITCATTELPHGISQHWVDTFCWISDKQGAPIQIVGTKYSKTSTSHYQFTVETLIFITMVLSLPGYIWNVILGQSGYKLRTISTLIDAIKQTVGRQRASNINELAGHLQITRRYHRLYWTFTDKLRRRILNLNSSDRFIQCHRKCWYQNRYYIPIIYLLIKLFYIVVIVFVFFLIEYCLGFKYISFGLPIINKITFKNTSTLLDERFFPRRAWCRISRPKLGGMDETWADCLLPINEINNIVFSLLWFWLMVVLLASVYGLCRTLFRMFPFNTRLFLGHHLQAHDLHRIEDSAAIADFIHKCPPDVVLMLQLYEIELGKTLVGEIISQLFLMFKKDHVPMSPVIELP